MPGGRPARVQAGYPELAELAEWFREAITGCGHSSVNAFVQQHTLDKNKVYEVVRGTVLLSLDSTRRLAQLLRRDPADVEPVWLRAKEAMDRRLMAEEADGRPQVTAWAEIPRPELALRNMLDALINAVDQLPYRLLGVAPPPLSTVYVRQRLRRESAAEGDTNKGRGGGEGRAEHGETSAADTLLTVADVLDRHEHVLITGEPGAGKSTLGHQLVSQLARIWLRQESAADPPLTEPVVPVRISARSLVREGSWSTILAEATRHALGPYLVTEPSPQLFARRTHGARWLVVVDGLDEILERATRASIIRALGQHARTGGEYRFVITTRPLPDEELLPLRGGHMGMCRIAPFEREELRLFAERWFLAQDPITAEGRAARFLHQVGDGRLKELVRNPLLATIAAVANTREPERPLPTNRVDLYQRFYEYLVTDEEASGRATLSELRRLRDGQPVRYRLAEWTHARRATIIDALARERMTTETPLTDVACAWVREHRPGDMELPPGWEKDLDRLLIDTGMFVYESSGVRFLHHTFAEFLAARTYAGEMPADFPDMEDWIQRGLKEAQQNFVLLTLVQWGRRPGHGPAAVLERLLEGGRDRVLLAGRLLAESGEVGDQHSRVVVDRLVDLFLGSAILGGQDSAHIGFRPVRLEDRYASAQQVVVVLALLHGNDHATARLREIVGRAELPFPTRVVALIALAQVTTDAEAARRLRDIAPAACGPAELALVAGGLIEWEPQVPDEARALLREVVGHPDTDAETRLDVAEILAETGDKAGAAAAAEGILADAEAFPVDIRSAVKLLRDDAKCLPVLGPEEIWRKLANRTADTLIALAEEFANAGEGQLAIRVVREAFGLPKELEHLAARAVRVWLSVDEDATEDILGLLRRRPKSERRTRAHAAAALAAAGRTAPAQDLARAVFEEPDADGYATGKAVEALLSVVGEGFVKEVTALLDQDPRPDAWARAAICETLAEAGHTVPAAEFARTVFPDPTADLYDVRQAARVCQHLDAAQRAALREDIVLPASPDAQGRTRLVITLAELGDRERTEELARAVLADHSAERGFVREAVQALIAVHGDARAAETVLAAFGERPGTAPHRFVAADALATAGALSAAVSLWCELLVVTEVPPADSVLVLTRLLHTGYRERALDTLRTALEARELRPPQRARLRSLLAWATFSDPGAAACESRPE